MNKNLLRALAVSALSYTPLYSRLAYGRAVIENQEEYYLDIWLSNAAHYREQCGGEPSRVVELGPGSTLGAGLWALLLGAGRYTAIDSVQLTDLGRNLDFLETAVRRTGQGDFNANFQRYGVDPAEAVAAVARRAERVGDELNRLFEGKSGLMAYLTPESVRPGDAPGNDLVFSHAVLEHVDDIDAVNESVYNLLRDGGCGIHVIDLSCHMTHTLWNGHWTYSAWLWRVLRGARSYLINRKGATEYEQSLLRAGFSIKRFERKRSDNALVRDSLAGEFAHLPDDDLTTSGLLVVACK
jgi:SAM-dependent methyltransferase